jgi:hypothetical protein
MYAMLLLVFSSYFMREVYHRTIDTLAISIVLGAPYILPVWKARGLTARLPTGPVQLVKLEDVLILGKCVNLSPV